MARANQPRTPKKKSKKKESAATDTPAKSKKRKSANEVPHAATDAPTGSAKKRKNDHETTPRKSRRLDGQHSPAPTVDPTLTPASSQAADSNTVPSGMASRSARCPCESMSQPPPVQLFDFDLARTQAQQRELTVYSYSLVGLMELYWPTANGVPLSPVELVHFIQDQGLHWPCFCSRIEHRPVSSSIILEGESGFVYCHYAQARCSFFIPLNEIRRTASLFHEYPSSVGSFAPYTTSLLSAFILDRARVFRLFGPQQLTGYLGDFHPDIQQLCKHPLFTTDLNGRPGPRHCVQPPNTHVEARTQTEPPQYHSSTIVYPTVVETRRSQLPL
ncbi:hypothetical protein B0H14DRAFT_3489056 [Mycena olivaceomarginata]|nr:hypothetical protein B0H14DRAFT_3489056 [Mycena olivaceomarginata]